jgi:hypothetical protein
MISPIPTSCGGSQCFYFQLEKYDFNFLKTKNEAKFGHHFNHATQKKP